MIAESVILIICIGSNVYIWVLGLKKISGQLLLLEEVRWHLHVNQCGVVCQCAFVICSDSVMSKEEVESVGKLVLLRVYKYCTAPTSSTMEKMRCISAFW